VVVLIFFCFGYLGQDQREKEVAIFLFTASESEIFPLKMSMSPLYMGCNVGE
jgi:hypothetical protein